MQGFVLTGELGARMFDFYRLRTMLRLEVTTGRKCWRESVINSAVSHGHVPAVVVARGNIHKRRAAALKYMDYVGTLVNARGVGTEFGREIIAGWLEYNGHDECGCPNYRGTAASAFLNDIEIGVMCIGHDK